MRKKVFKHVLGWFGSSSGQKIENSIFQILGFFFAERLSILGVFFAESYSYIFLKGVWVGGGVGGNLEYHNCPPPPPPPTFRSRNKCIGF